MNAIILAAGLGSRFKEMTENQHKSLLLIDGKPNLERTIEMLRDAGVEQIIIVTGYLSSKFKYLKEKYEEIILIDNKKYREYNNIYTFSKILPYFNNSYVIDADTVLYKNIFKSMDKSTYFTVNRLEDSVEWCPIINNQKRVIDMLITDEKRPSLSGISYWNEKECKVIKESITNYMTEDKLRDSSLYWDNIPLDNLDKLDIRAESLEDNIIFEMDNQENYFAIQEMFANF